MASRARPNADSSDRPASQSPLPSLGDAAIEALKASDPAIKTMLAERAATDWLARRLSLRSRLRRQPPDRPGRPSRPKLIAPTGVAKRKLGSVQGRIALIHAICHIELNAVDLALDIVARFCGQRMPVSFFDDWMTVAREEAKHFNLLRGRLNELGADYGDLAAHDGLWEAAQETVDDLTARLALVPLVLEARGLDVTPGLVAALEKVGDRETARLFAIIYHDEKGHVAVGAKWFRFLCRKSGLDPATSFQSLVRKHFRGQLKPPFNELARAANGLTPTFYRTLSSAGR